MTLSQQYASAVQICIQIGVRLMQMVISKKISLCSKTGIGFIYENKWGKITYNGGRDKFLSHSNIPLKCRGHDSDNSASASTNSTHGLTYLICNFNIEIFITEWCHMYSAGSIKNIKPKKMKQNRARINPGNKFDIRHKIGKSPFYPLLVCPFST